MAFLFLHRKPIKKLLNPNGLIYLEVQIFLNDLFKKNNLTVLNISTNQGPKVPTSTFLEYSSISILATNNFIENTNVKRFRRHSYFDIKIRPFINDILLIVKSILNSFLNILKQICYLIFSSFSFLFPKLAKLFLKTINR